MNITKLMLDARFFMLVIKIDIEFAEKTRKAECPYCGGTLHFARYNRKGRSILDKYSDDWNLFHSLCCANEKCRKRVRPLSIRFAGRSSFSAALVLLANLLASGGSTHSVIAIGKELNVSERTIRRWHRFWVVVCAKSKWWRKIASNWSLSGKILFDFWNLLRKTKKTIKNAFKYLLFQSATLWGEITFFDG